jgi:hypothetical protein
LWWLEKWLEEQEAWLHISTPVVIMFREKIPSDNIVIYFLLALELRFPPMYEQFFFLTKRMRIYSRKYLETGAFSVNQK